MLTLNNKRTAPEFKCYVDNRGYKINRVYIFEVVTSVFLFAAGFAFSLVLEIVYFSQTL